MSYIATTTEDDVQWLMAAGQSLGLAVAQLRHHLAQNLSPAHGALLAEPVEDAVGRATDWYGAGEGEAVPLDQLAPGRRAAMTNRVWALLRDIRAEGVRLGAAADSDERVLGAMLEKVSHVPDLGCVRVRDDAPLVIAWAHGRAGQSVDLSAVFKPVDVPPTRPVADAPARQGGLPGWLLPALIVASVVLAVGLVMWLQRQPSETASIAAPPPPVVLANPVTPPAVLVPTPAPQPRPDASAQIAPTPRSGTAAVARDSTAIASTQATAPPAPPPATPPVASTDSVPPSTSSSTSSLDRFDTASGATSSSNPPAPGSSTERPDRADATPQPGAPQPDAPPPDAPHADGAAPPIAAASAPSAVTQLPPHEAEATAGSRPFTAASVHKHDLALLQGCWSFGGDFASADVQTHAPAKVGQWRTCFAPPQQGAASLAGTQSLAWQDGKSCSGPVTARFLADDKLEIADAADCLGDRRLLRMSEQCARKDDTAMTCAWTARDVHGDGLTLTPAR